MPFFFNTRKNRFFFFSQFCDTQKKRNLLQLQNHKTFTKEIFFHCQISKHAQKKSFFFVQNLDNKNRILFSLPKSFSIKKEMNFIHLHLEL